ncbi:MAG: hypothetical protein ABL890_04505 [Candidatus Peribacteraceae bacterium]
MNSSIPEIVEAPFALFGDCTVDVQAGPNIVLVRNIRGDGETLYWVQELTDQCGGDVRTALQELARDGIAIL